MAIKVAGTTVIDDNRKMINVDTVNLHSSNSLVIPTGTTAQRPADPVSGTLRFNSETGSAEIHNGAEFKAVGGVSIVSSLIFG